MQTSNLRRNQSGSAIKVVIKIMLAVGIIFAAVAISRYWLSNKPRAVRKPREVKAALVETDKISKSNYNILIDAMGTVSPARSMELTSRVSGEIVRVSPEFFPGGHLTEGSLVLEIDKKDYKLLLEESKLAIEKANIAIDQSDLSIEQSGQAIEQSELAIEQSNFAIEQSELNIEQSELSIEQRRAEVIKVEKDLLLEKGQQKIALREYEVLGDTIDDIDSDLVLRKPQLKASEAALTAGKARLKEAEGTKNLAIAAKKSALTAKKSAEAAKKSAQISKESAQAAKKSAEAAKKTAEVNFEKAQLNLQHTDILAPFDSIIQSKKVEIGSFISPGIPLLRIVDCSEYWVIVSIPVDRLKWISIPNSAKTEGSLVRIYHEAGWGNGIFRVGRVKRLMSEVEQGGRMAKLIVAVNDPLCIKAENSGSPRMLLDSYVRVEIEGSKLTDVVKVPRTSLHDASYVWILSPENTLDIREIEIIWSDKGSVYVTNHLHNDELIITSDLATPVQGMSLRLSGSEVKADKSAPSDTGSKDSKQEKR